MAGRKFCGSTSRLLLLSVPVFIMLSGAVVTEKIRSCYWCGPLAEQVHRSQRAPPCEAADDHVTTCDIDMPYCAVIATSPPYAESRLCVKLYQDECYPLFCNSTKTWKMTCPCRGELCNGPNTERENEAFAILAKLVAKTRNTRIKKRTQPNNSKFIPSGVEKTLIVTNMSILENNVLTLDTNATNNVEITKIMLSDEPAIIQNTKSEDVSSLEMLSTSGSIDENNKITTTEANVANVADHNSNMPPDSKEVTVSEELINTEKVDSVVKPSEQLPAAEALQQNPTPKSVNEKTVLPTTASFEATDQTTTDDDIETTTMKDDNKNGAHNFFTTLYITFLTVVPLHVYYYKIFLSHLH